MIMEEYLENIKKDVIKASEQRTDEQANEKYMIELDEEAKLSIISIRKWVKFFGVVAIIVLVLCLALGLYSVKDILIH